MTPTIALGPWDSPSAEFMPWDIYPIIALLLEDGHSSADGVLQPVWTFLQLDTVFLNKKSEPFFLRLETACRRVLDGEVTGYDAAKLRASEFADYMKGCAQDGVLTPGVRDAAQRYLDLLASNPEYWPLPATAA